MLKEAPRKWTVMIYLACDNNLSAEGIDALKELKKLPIGADEDVTVIAQFDPFGGDPTSPGGIPTLRFVLSQDEKDWRLYEDITDALGETNTGDKSTLGDFLDWGTKKYPAEHYMVILSGHGAGIEPGFLLRDESVPAAGPDEVVRNYLPIRELRDVFSEMRDKTRRKVDIVGFDNCLMSMAEVAYELRESVRYFISSEGFDPNGGWPYFRIVSPLVRHCDEPLDRLCRSIVRNYIRYYGDFMFGGVSVDLAALDLRECDALAYAMKTLSDVLAKELNGPRYADIRNALVLAHWEAQSYNGEQFVDLYDFCDLLEKKYPYDPVAPACLCVREVIRNMVVLSCYAGGAFQYSYGLSIYFPWSQVEKYYSYLTFASSSGWIGFLSAYVMLTRRQPRGLDQKDMGRSHVESLGAQWAKGLAGSLGESPRTDTQMGGPWYMLKLPPEDRGPSGIVQSMRNPPHTFALSDCLKNHSECVQRTGEED